MSKLVLPKATTEVRETATPVAGEIFYDQDKQAVFFGDGATMGGISLKAGSMSTAYVYGIDHDTSVATAATACKRVLLNHDHDQMGDVLRYTQVTEFAQMPAHNFKRCVMSDLANRVVAYYLNASDSTKKENGQTAILTGADGDVMVEIPVCHFRLDTYTDASNHVHNVYLVSNRAFNGSAIHRYFYTSPGGATARVQYVGAFRAILCNSNGTPKAQTSEDNPASYVTGDCFRSIIGERPHGNGTREKYRIGSSVNGGTNINGMFGQFLTLMMAIDVCSFDFQTKISRGYADLSVWKYAALRKTGRTVVFGNGTGEILADETAGTGLDIDLLTMDNGQSIWHSSATSKVVQFSYRGIEDPFGSQWCIEDGCQKNQDSNADDYDGSGFWCTNDTTKYNLCDTDMGSGNPDGSFPAVGYTGAGYVWVSVPFPKKNGYVKDFDPITFLCTSIGGSSTTYLPDYFNNVATAGGCIFCRGGYLSLASQVGLGGVTVQYATTHAYGSIGCRIAA